MLIAPELLQSQTAYHLIEKSYCPVEEVSAKVFEGISDRERPTGLVAIIRTPVLPLEKMSIPSDGLYLLLEAIADPGNLGTILRSADAVAADGVILCGRGTDLTHPTALKASMGAAFTVPIAAIEDVAEVTQWNQAAHLVATSARGERDFWEPLLRPGRPTVILLGNEQRGLSDALFRAADLSVKIPMWGQASSLTVGTSATLLIYEVRRQARSQ